MNRDHPHLAADVLHRDTYGFATGGLVAKFYLADLVGIQVAHVGLVRHAPLSMGSRFGGRQLDIIRYSPDCLEGLIWEVLRFIYSTMIRSGVGMLTDGYRFSRIMQICVLAPPGQSRRNGAFTGKARELLRHTSPHLEKVSPERG